MTDHPSSFRAEGSHRNGIQWDDRASLHRIDDGDGVLSGAKGLRRGTFAELIRHLMALPPESRTDYCIEKSGDRAYQAREIEELARRPDFPTE